MREARTEPVVVPPPDGARNPEVADLDRLDTEAGALPQGGVTPATPDQVDERRGTPPPDSGAPTGVSSTELDESERIDEPAPYGQGAAR